jgi:hypothetical protein
MASPNFGWFVKSESTLPLPPGKSPANLCNAFEQGGQHSAHLGRAILGLCTGQDKVKTVSAHKGREQACDARII